MVVPSIRSEPVPSGPAEANILRISNIVLKHHFRVPWSVTAGAGIGVLSTRPERGRRKLPSLVS
jgi:hypothetical protein